MIRYFRIYTGGNTSRPIHHHKPRTSKIGSIVNSLDGTHRIAYFRAPYRPFGAA